MNDQNPNPDEQHWDVFRYVSGEMSAGEEAYFEDRLANDQQLREEVASMVSMLGKVDNAFATAKVTPAEAARVARLRIRRIVVSVAALILFATLAIVLTPRNELSNSNAESVAVAWAEAIDAEEFELPEQDADFEFASFEMDNEDDWIVDVVTAVNDESAIN